MSPWVLATRNGGKLVELRELFATYGIGVVTLRDVGVEEDASAEAQIESFDTFEENALAKARYFQERLPGRTIVADDSGLSVDALDGVPGVRSKRWNGRADLHGSELDAANNAKLAAAVRGIENRQARFVCAAAFSDGADEIVVRGEVLGEIVDDARGEHGFGYDPHFFVSEIGMTLAQATVAEKARVSHRGRAFARLCAELRARGVMNLPK